MIEFVVYGSPTSLKRHRSFTKAGRVVMYDPSKGSKQDFLSQAIKAKPSVPLARPIRLEVHAFFARPLSHFNKKGLKQGAPEFCDKIPDADNILKFVGDALNQVFWADDKFIVEAFVVKKYSDVPRVEIKIKEVIII